MPRSIWLNLRSFGQDGADLHEVTLLATGLHRHISRQAQPDLDAKGARQVCQTPPDQWRNTTMTSLVRSERTRRRALRRPVGPATEPDNSHNVKSPAR